MLHFINEALFDALSSDSDLTNLVDDQIFINQAPLDITPPYVIFTLVRGGYVNDSPRLTVDVIYRVECVGVTQNQSMTGANLIQAILHDQALTLDGWAHYDTTAGEGFSAIANEDGRQWYRTGTEYRLRAAKN